MRRLRLAALVVAAIAAGAVGGCGGDDNETGGGTTTAGNGGPELPECPVGALDEAGGEPVEITFWHAMFAEANEKLLRDLVDGFHAAQDRVRVTLVQQPSLAEAMLKYRAGLDSGDLPDLVQLGETSLQALVDSRSLLPVQSCVDAEDYDLSDFAPRAVAYYTLEGALQAMPWAVGNPVLYYNRVLFEEAGLDPDKPPRTLEEVREYSEKIVASGAAKHGIALRVEGYYLEYWFAKAGAEYVDNGNGREARATRSLIDSDTGREVFEWWNEMVESGLALDTGSQPNNFDHLLAVGTGNAAMAFEAAAGLGPIKAVLAGGDYGELALGVGPLPGPRAEGGLPLGDSALWIPGRLSPEKQAAAWELVKWLVEPEQQAALHLGAGYVPIRLSVVDLPEVEQRWADEPEWRVAYDQLLAGPDDAASAGAVIGDFEGVRQAVRDALTATLAGDLSPAEAVAQAQQGADRAIEEYNARVAG